MKYFGIIFTVIVCGIIATLVTLALTIPEHHTPPELWHKNLRDNCIIAHGQVKEDDNGYYDGCIYPVVSSSK